ncbi:phage replisome organizer N-terminal domain-containing protein [Weissella cibaria]|uniref:phage replisome organizer N-terminal domain-containing protein n=1 Tax=Weissella cibaria TaxID=137591 RepID=UPI001C1FD1DB|nr:phage replisome organizer N-terminal domain-containing protein [Weissella cibaria]MBU7544730.1 phage replisome organizer N-terminal domain-containing protein [Weissella cibaria]MCV3317707.1 phage replisome organizer N-terminal domain-containing protein [Weissella cibaria]
MSDNKKNYYIRLKDSTFDRECMVALEAMEEGYAYQVLYFKLMLLSLKGDGMLRYSEDRPYTVELLARLYRMSVGTVQRGINILENMELIQCFADGTIYILDIQEHIGKTSSEAERKRAYRAKLKERKQLEMSGHLSDERPPELETELDIDKETESDSFSNNNTSISHTWAQAARKAFKELGLPEPSETVIGTLLLPIGEWFQFAYEGQAQLMLDDAVATAVKADKRNWGYVEGILKSWQDAGISTMADVFQERLKWDERNKPFDSQSNSADTVDIPTDVDILNTDWSKY